MLQFGVSETLGAFRRSVHSKSNLKERKGELMQNSKKQDIVVHDMTAQCSAVQNSAVQYTTWQDSTVRCS